MTILTFLVVVAQIFAAEEALVKTITINYPDKTVDKTEGVAVLGASYTFTVSGAPDGSRYEWTLSAVGGKWTGSGASRTFKPDGTNKSTKYTFKVKVFPPGPGEGAPWMTSGSEVLDNPIIKFSQPSKDMYVPQVELGGSYSPIAVVVKVTHDEKTLGGVTVKFKEKKTVIGSLSPAFVNTKSGANSGIAATEFTLKSTAVGGDSTILQAQCGATVADGPMVAVVLVEIKSIKPDTFREYGQSTTIVLQASPSDYTGYKELRIYNSSGSEVKSYLSLTTWSVQWNGQDNSGKYVWPGTYSVKVAIESNGTPTDTETVTVNPKLHNTGITHDNKFLKTAWRWVTGSIALSSKTMMRFNPDNVEWPESDYPLSYIWGGIFSGTTKSITNNFSATAHKAGRWDGTLKIDTQDKQSDSDKVDIILGAVPAQATIKVKEDKKAIMWSKEAKIKYKLGSERKTFYRQWDSKDHNYVVVEYAHFLTADGEGSVWVEIEYDKDTQLRIWVANFVNLQAGFGSGAYDTNPNKPLQDPPRTELYE
jgi:hypothetical protein